MRTRMVPRGARRLRTYAEFESYLAQFADGKYPFLWVVGRPGVAKTQSITIATRGRQVYYRTGGQLTPLQFYMDCFRHRGQPIILDDAEHLLDERLGAKFVSALGDTTPSRLMCYGSRTQALRETNIPETFYTTSPLCIIANKGTAHEPIQSRAVTLYFDPTQIEIHRAVALWFWDQEIHDFFGQHLTRIQAIDTRWYVIADRDKEAGRDWRQILLAGRALDHATSIVQDLETDTAYPTREARALRFIALMGQAKGASRASYFRLRKRLEESGRLVVEASPSIRLRRRHRPATPSLAELEAMVDRPAPPPEDEPLADLPAHDAFMQPIRGTTPVQSPTGVGHVVIDDTMAWESPATGDQGEGYEE
jgi:hypothetical protein